MRRAAAVAVPSVRRWPRLTGRGAAPTLDAPGLAVLPAPAAGPGAARSSLLITVSTLTCRRAARSAARPASLGHVKSATRRSDVPEGGALPAARPARGGCAPRAVTRGPLGWARAAVGARICHLHRRHPPSPSPESCAADPATAALRHERRSIGRAHTLRCLRMRRCAPPPSTPAAVCAASPPLAPITRRHHTALCPRDRSLQRPPARQRQCGRARCTRSLRCRRPSFLRTAGRSTATRPSAQLRVAEWSRRGIAMARTRPIRCSACVSPPSASLSKHHSPPLSPLPRSPLRRNTNDLKPRRSTHAHTALHSPNERLHNSTPHSTH
jgi:hypothetical protein